MRNLWPWEPTIELLTPYSLEDLSTFDRIFVGFSGGLDSTALVHYLSMKAALKSKLRILHVNHGLSPNAATWALHCQNFCSALNIPLTIYEAKLSIRANIEEQAREARYNFFASQILESDVLVLAHHQDDQAETLLLQLCRGAGVEGLAAMPALQDFAKAKLFRPLLSHSRTSLVSYVSNYSLTFIDDESNFDCKFSRNFIRHQILPALEQRWAKVKANIARTAEHCLAAKAKLEVLAIQDYPELTLESQYLDLKKLRLLDLARIKNIVRLWLRKNQLSAPSTHILNRIVEIIFTKTSTLPKVAWGNVFIIRYQDKLCLTFKALEQNFNLVWEKFPEVLILDKQRSLTVKPAKTGLFIPEDALIEVKFRQGGESIRWHGQRKSLKKLLQEWKVPSWLRENLPLVYINSKLALVVGYALADDFYVEQGSCFDIELSSNRSD